MSPPTAAPSTDERIPTHRCKVCGAFWILYPANAWAPESNPGRNAWWSLGTNQQCGPCCDNVAMGEQIESLADAYKGLIKRSLFPPVTEGHPERTLLNKLICRKLSVDAAARWLRNYIHEGIEGPLP